MSDITKQEFDETLNSILEILEREQKLINVITAIPGVHELIAEEFNNEVINTWEEKIAEDRAHENQKEAD
jgi:hypothetical protein